MANIKIRTQPGADSKLVRPRPQGDSQFWLWVSEREKFSAYVHAGVIDFIRQEGKAAAPNETIGLLAGRICHDPVYGPYTLIMIAENALPGEFESTPGNVKLIANGQSQVRRRLEEAHPDREIIGWYHTHPNYAPMFSPVDAKEQKTWKDQNYIGIVYSTDGDGPESFGVYRGPDSNRLRAVPNTAPTPVPVPSPSPGIETTTADLTPRPGPLAVKEKILTSTPAARLTRNQALILSLIAIICAAQAIGLYRLDRRVSFAEGRLAQLSLAPTAPERSREIAPVQASTPKPATRESSASQTDGPALQVPVKPLTPSPAPPRPQQSPAQKRAKTPDAPRAASATKSDKAKKPDVEKADEKKSTPTSANATQAKPAEDPKPKPTPK